MPCFFAPATFICAGRFTCAKFSLVYGIKGFASLVRWNFRNSGLCQSVLRFFAVFFSRYQTYELLQVLLLIMMSENFLLDFWISQALTYLVFRFLISVAHNCITSRLSTFDSVVADVGLTFYVSCEMFDTFSGFLFHTSEYCSADENVFVPYRVFLNVR